jgi:hypothetical protein
MRLGAISTLAEFLGMHSMAQIRWVGILSILFARARV